MELEEAIKHIIDGNAILFYGAGFSSEATNILNEKMKDANKLTHDLCDIMKIPRSEDLGKVSNYYLKQPNSSRQRLIALLQNYYMCKSVCDCHKIIAKCDWRRIYTTNYDDVLEFASKSLTNNRKIKTLIDKVDAAKDKGTVFHLNGYIRNLTPEKLDNEFKLTTMSYLISDYEKSEVKNLFEHDIKNAKAIIVIGTSLNYDLEILKTIYAYNDIKDKLIFINRIVDDKHPESLDEIFNNSTKNEIGNIFKIGLENFSKEIQNLQNVYTRNTQMFKFRSFEKIRIDETSFCAVNKEDLWSLFLFGNIEDKLMSQYYDSNKYLFKREKLKTVMDQLTDTNTQLVIIHSNLGNGKTCFITQLAYTLSKKNNVFWYRNEYDAIEEEIEQIIALPGMKYIIIENYNFNFKLLCKFQQLTRENIKFICTCRTYINQSLYNKLISNTNLYFKEDNVYECDLNELIDDEPQKLVNLLNNMDIKYTKIMSNSQIKKKLAKDCNNNLSEFLLEFVKSKTIAAKIDDLYKEILKEKDVYNLLLATIVCNASSMELTLDDLARLLDIKNISTKMAHNDTYKELFDFKNNIIRMRSSIFAKYITVEKKLPRELLDTMNNMVTHSTKLGPDKRAMVRRHLISVSNMDQIFEKSSKFICDEIVLYFDKMQQLGFYEKNNFFWLQYAMACLDAHQYDRAGNNFDIAFELAKNVAKRDFEPYQIDIQYGRYLLERNINFEKASDPFKVFKTAHYKFIAAIKNDYAQSFYVYKQIVLYKRFIKHYINEFSNTNCNKIIKYCDDFMKAIILKEGREALLKQSLIKHTYSELESCKRTILFRISYNNSEESSTNLVNKEVATTDENYKYNSKE